MIPTFLVKVIEALRRLLCCQWQSTLRRQLGPPWNDGLLAVRVLSSTMIQISRNAKIPPFDRLSKYPRLTQCECNSTLQFCSEHTQGNVVVQGFYKQLVGEQPEPNCDELKECRQSTRSNDGRFFDKLQSRTTPLKRPAASMNLQPAGTPSQQSAG